MLLVVHVRCETYVVRDSYEFCDTQVAQYRLVESGGIDGPARRRLPSRVRPARPPDSGTESRMRAGRTRGEYSQ